LIAVEVDTPHPPPKEILHPPPFLIATKKRVETAASLSFQEYLPPFSLPFLHRTADLVQRYESLLSFFLKFKIQSEHNLLHAKTCDGIQGPFFFSARDIDYTSPPVGPIFFFSQRQSSMRGPSSFFPYFPFHAAKVGIGSKRGRSVSVRGGILLFSLPPRLRVGGRVFSGRPPRQSPS